MNRKYLVAAAAALAMAGCAGQEQPKQAKAPDSIKADMMQVKLETAPLTYEASGVVRAKLNATLSSKAVGKVAAVFVREGDAVALGRPLVQLDSRELSASVQVASAGVSAAEAAARNAVTGALMEQKSSAARIASAQSQLGQSRAALAAARARLDLALAGPRPQEREQAKLAVDQAKAGLTYAEVELARAKNLVAQGAVPRRQLDQAQAAYDVAQAQYRTAIQAQRIADEGTRAEDIRSAKDAVSQAEAAVRQAEAGVKEANAAALQVDLRNGEIKSAQAQAALSQASLRSAQVALAYAGVDAPFDGVVTRRFVDPGSFASTGTPLVALEGGGFRLEVSVPESVMPHVQIGESVFVDLDGFPGQSLGGKVVEIVPEGDATAHSYTVRIQLQPTSGLRSGMFGRALIPIGQKRGIFVPSIAVQDREGLKYVFVVGPDNLARLRIVTVGDSSSGKTELLSGVDAGEKIVSGDLQGVRDGVEVR